MDQTKVDDTLIEMITPKVTEIQKKFSDGGALTQDNINTLLLKSQYNHINHLDLKLNEVVTDVSSLKSDFKLFKTELKTDVKDEISDFRAEVKRDLTDFKAEIKIDFADLREDFSDLKSDMAEFKTEIKNDMVEFKTEIRNDMAEFKTEIKNDMADLREDINLLRSEFKLLESKFDILSENVEKTIAKALNKNMTLLVVVMGFFLSLSKLIDRI